MTNRPRALNAAALLVALLVVSLAAVIEPAPASAVLPTSACKISAPLAPRFPTPVDPAYPAGMFPDFVQYQATNGGGTYAGVAVNWGYRMTFRVIKYSAGRVSVLDTITLTGRTASPFDNAVKVVGIDSHGNVIVGVQVAGSIPEQQRYIGYRYDAAGHRSLLQDSPRWNSFEPVGVSAQGVVVGWARYAPLERAQATEVQTVAWTGTGRGQVRLIGTRSEAIPRAVNRSGDILYPSSVLLADGSFYQLRHLAQSPYFGAGGTRLTDFAAYGITSTNGDNELAVQWKFPTPSAPAAGAIVTPHLISYLVWVNAVSARGDVVGEFPGNYLPDGGVRVLVTRTGKAYRLPVQFKLPIGNGPEPATVIDDYGQVVYTGTDGLPHLMTCPM